MYTCSLNLTWSLSQNYVQQLYTSIVLWLTYGRILTDGYNISSTVDALIARNKKSKF